MRISKDKVKKLAGFFATTRLIQDWKAAEFVWTTTQQPPCTCGPRFGLSLSSGKNS